MINSSILWQYSLFDGLEKEQIDYILTLVKHEVCEEGQDIVLEDGPNDKIHFILDGRVSVMKHDVTLMELDEGDIFGEMEVLEILPVEATIRAITKTKLITLSLDALGELFENDLKTYSFIITNLARDLSRRLRRMNVRVVKESPAAEWS